MTCPMRVLVYLNRKSRGRMNIYKSKRIKDQKRKMMIHLLLKNKPKFFQTRGDRTSKKV